MNICIIFILFSIYLMTQNHFMAKELPMCHIKSLNCVSYNKSVGEFRHCYIKAVGRNDNYVGINYNLKEMVNDIVVRVRLFKRANGWKPFLYDAKVDACKFYRNIEANPLAKYFFNVVKPYTNMNHTCPYYPGDIILDKLRILASEVTLPFPDGEYAIDVSMFSNNIETVRINGSCTGTNKYQW